MTVSTLERAREALAPHILRTPLIQSDALSEAVGAEVYIKLESLQRTGSFKIRGALWKLLDLGEEAKERGVVTASTGNHARGMVLACNLLSIPGKIYVPETVSQRAANVMKQGLVEPVRQGKGYDETEAIARDEARDRGLPFVSAFDDERIIEGNGGTLGLEILDEQPDLDALIAPVGGGGLIGGLGLALQERHSPASLFGAQSEMSCAMARSLEEDRPILTLPPVETLAIRLEGGVAKRTFDLAKRFVREIAVLEEVEIARAVRFTVLKMGLVAEPSGAVGIAALLTRKVKGDFKKIGVVVSGGNIDPEVLVELLERSHS